jgi:hypothetical protein
VLLDWTATPRETRTLVDVFVPAADRGRPDQSAVRPDSHDGAVDPEAARSRRASTPVPVATALQRGERGGDRSRVVRVNRVTGRVGDVGGVTAPSRGFRVLAAGFQEGGVCARSRKVVAVRGELVNDVLEVGVETAVMRVHGGLATPFPVIRRTGNTIKNINYSVIFGKT